MGTPMMQCNTMNRCQVVGDIIESIAMIEKALAHILNAEGEKLLATINAPDVTTEQLLAVNRSVKITVESISRLEILLQAKLNLFSDMICQ